MVITGLEKFFAEYDQYQHKSIGLVVNQTSITRDCWYSWEECSRLKLRVHTIFSPEHGLWSTEQDQVAVEEQPLLVGTPIVSLYGKNRESLLPDMRVLEQIDMLVFDIQDVGSRYYTYLNTLAMLMERLQGTGIELLVLDRPNPLGGERVEGPALSSDYTSFVGVLPVPVRHGLTAGELALLYKDLKSLDVLLTVLPLENWERKYHFDQTGLPWVPPSPNMPTLHTAMVYPGMCLLEGTNLSEGRGTTTPFELCGAPGIDPDLWCRRLQEYNLPGIKFRPVYFKPTFHKYAGTTCGGVCLHVVERNSFQPFRSGLALIATCMELFPGYEFLHDVYEFESRYPAFDYLAGSGAIREMLQAGTPITDIVTSWQNYQKEFLVMKKEYHLYT